ncbi:hypothetical protein QOL99_04345 [Deinococcus sp. MIMF12]|uniref:Nucleotidyltransferase domain-containing protein n=1 Tax=Deinococcus rhizophilus TaxID=3049544 RepID=A0ABT7JE98_9DEIO|nr:hypothetical protein [Deinococcus rhizophilus]MDL2343379.1 hypothetical protein [Deinococcus rhizophilus]
MLDPALRQSLLQGLQVALEAQPSVQAAWLEGADALGKADEFSDLDLWLDVTAGNEETALAAVRNAVRVFGPLDVEQERAHPDPFIRQVFYRSAGLPRFLFVDVCVQTHGREVVFGPADAFLPLFDRVGVLRQGASAPIDLRVEIADVLAGRWRHVLVEKELQRGHVLEARGYFHDEVLAPLVRLLRLKHCPEKRDYGLKHISVDLPADDLQRLERLYSLTTTEELRGGVQRVNDWLDELGNDSYSLP